MAGARLLRSACPAEARTAIAAVLGVAAEDILVRDRSNETPLTLPLIYDSRSNGPPQR
ncbi:MAG TPA: hypothetical protein VNY53_21175 [Bradyrhizobium sp.]|nr:hypothetical protein [Bradyrhizobium sp.]